MTTQQQQWPEENVTSSQIFIKLKNKTVFTFSSSVTTFQNKFAKQTYKCAKTDML